MKLYNGNLSPFATRCRIQLKAKGLDVEMVDRTTIEDFTTVSPIGRIPALDLDGEVLPESQVICNYIEEIHPEPSLLPDKPLDRARMDLLTRLIDIYYMPSIVSLFGQMDPGSREQEKVDEAIAEFDKALGYLEIYLSGGTYAVGDKLTLADCALMPCLFFAPKLLPAFGKSDPLNDFPKVKKYFDEIITVEPVAAANAEMEEALKQMMAQRAQG